MNRSSFLLLRLVLPLLALPAAGSAAPLPLWEAGIGLGALYLPDYRGADAGRNYLAPAPYFVYRGERLKADRNGVRGRLLAGERAELSLSLNATVPVHSGDNAARSGMPYLRPTIEAGPSLQVRLWESPARDARLALRLPVRGAFTLESSPRQVGWLFSPNLQLAVNDPAGFAGWRLSAQAGPIFGSRRYNDHVYSVAPAYATARRPAYQAPGGYAGTQATLTVARRFPRYWIGGFLRHDNLAGAAFADSPLVRRKNNLSAGIAIGWVFGQSSSRVEAEE